MICKECGNKLILSPEGFYVCSVCGLVHEEFTPFYYDKIKEDENIFSYEQTGSYIRYDGISREISYNLSKLHLFYCDSNYYKNTHYMVLGEFNTICEMLKVPSNIRKKALRLYYKMLKEIKKGSRKKIFHSKFLIGALIIAVRESDYELSYNDIIKTFNLRGHNISKADLMEVFSLANKLGLWKGYDIKRLSVRYVRIIVSHIKVKSSRSVIIRKAIELLNEMFIAIDRNFLLGRNPYILSVAFAYIALKNIEKIYGIKISVKRIASIVKYSESAIRADSLLIKKHVFSRKPYIRSIINHK